MPLARRSRHAATYLARIDAEPAVKSPSDGADGRRAQSQADGAQLSLFVKLFDPPKKLGGPLSFKLKGRALRVVRVTSELRARAFLAPSLLLWAEELNARRSLLISARAQGEPLPSAMARAAADSAARKWRWLAALGREVARLHRAGFVHGDLTPHNVLVLDEVQTRFVFLDHDRTFLPRLWRRRRQLRNLVQLGGPRFDFLSRADRMRFFRAYARADSPREKHRTLRQVNAMLIARRLRDQRHAAGSPGDLADQ